MEKKKIVHIAQSPGGVAQYLYMLLKNIDRTKYENILICSNDYKKEIERFENITDKIYFVDMVREIELKKDIKAVIELRKIIKTEKPDTVYMHSSKAGAIGRIALLFNRKINKIYNAHGWYFNAEIGKKKKILFTIIEKLLAYNTNIIINISNSEYTSALEKKIAKPKKMCIIENGIDFTEFDRVEQYRDNIRQKYNIKDNEILIGVVGRVSEQKDPITFIKAAKLVNDKYKNTKFMFVGSGELEDEVKEYAEKNNISENVFITGWVDNSKEYISAFDIAVLPSKWEGFGLAIIEYMASRKPIVATRVGGIADIIIDEEKGTLVKIGNEKDLAEAIMEKINNRDTEEKLNKNYSYCIEKYNINLMIEKTIVLV